MKLSPLTLSGLCLLLGAGSVSAQSELGPPAPSAPSPDAIIPTAPIAQPEIVASASTPINYLVLQAIQEMPKGGGYSVKREASQGLKSSIQIVPGAMGSSLAIHADLAQPSFCSGATYLVFLKTIETLMAQGKISLSPRQLSALTVNGQPDGEGVWGRWNANGPGTARLFYEVGLGPNYSSLAAARPGDFMKIFWNDEIGSKEEGHSVIYLGTHSSEEGEMVRFWSSNIVVGFSEKEVPLARIKRVLISRLENPQGIENVSLLPKRDDYLASMAICTSPADLMWAMVGVKSPPPENKDPPPQPVTQETPSLR
jgi:hypothetical protein